VAWIWETSIHSCLDNTNVIVNNIVFCLLNPLQEYVLVQRLTFALFKHLRKIVRAHTGNSGELPEAKVRREVVPI
jgi:hypothetical protein